MTFCPGYARGLGFVGDYAVVALSKPRDNKTFSGLALDANLAARDADRQAVSTVLPDARLSSI